MGATIALGNIVGITQYVFLKAIIPLQSDLNAHTTFCSNVTVKNFINRSLTFIKEFNKSIQAAIVSICLGSGAALICKLNTHATVQKGEFSQPLT